jgi:hypothetical protein
MVDHAFRRAVLDALAVQDCATPLLLKVFAPAALLGDVLILMARTTVKELLDKLDACECARHVEAERIFRRTTDPESTCVICDCSDIFRRIDRLTE